MKHKTTQHLYGYWNEVRQGRIAPRRLDIEPSRISDYLSDTFVLERSGARAYPYRLAGTRVCAAFGGEMRNLNFLDGWREGDRIAIERQFQTMADQGAATLLTIESGPEEGRPAIYEALILPLVHTADTIDRFIGSLSPLSPIIRAHRGQMRQKKLLTYETIWPEGRPFAVAEAMSKEAPFHPQMRQARIVRTDRRQFRVYDGGLLKSERGRQ